MDHLCFFSRREDEEVILTPVIRRFCDHSRAEDERDLRRQELS
jgi:hypothetical protein